MVAFGLSKLTPGDEIECGTGIADYGEEFSVYSKAYKKLYLSTAQDKGLDIPPFYFNINPWTYPDTLHKIVIKEERELSKELIVKWGNWPAIQNWKNEQANLALFLESIDTAFSSDDRIEVRRIISDLSLSSNKIAIRDKYSNLNDLLNIEATATYFNKASIAFDKIFEQEISWSRFIPTVHWFGFNNQYHNWISNLLKGDFGVSCRNGLPSGEKIKKSIYWTLMLNIPSILLAFLIALPLGIYSGMNQGKRLDRWTNAILFFLYSLPTFWLGTMLVVFFTTPEYSRFLDWFPSVGIGNLPTSAPLWDRFLESSSHMILPIFCNTYISLAFIFRQMRNNVLNVIPQNFVQTARAKGMDENSVLRKHIFKNAIFPIITLFGAILPGTISGSIVIEVIFNIPGMGRETLEAIFAQDWPIVYIILLLGAILTMFGLLIGDLLYTWLDPRVSFSQKNNSTAS